MLRLRGRSHPLNRTARPAEPSRAQSRAALAVLLAAPAEALARALRPAAGGRAAAARKLVAAIGRLCAVAAGSDARRQAGQRVVPRADAATAAAIAVDTAQRPRRTARSRPEVASPRRAADAGAAWLAAAADTALAGRKAAGDRVELAPGVGAEAAAAVAVDVAVIALLLAQVCPAHAAVTAERAAVLRARTGEAVGQAKIQAGEPGRSRGRLTTAAAAVRSASAGRARSQAASGGQADLPLTSSGTALDLRATRRAQALTLPR